MYQGALVDEPRHMARLAYSLGELRIDAPMAPKALLMVMREVVARNKVSYGYVYAVSYTHLDVYKRQSQNYAIISVLNYNFGSVLQKNENNLQLKI